MPLSRVTRSLGLRRHPLRRGTDVAEAWITVGLLAVLALAAPLLAWWAAGTAYDRGLQEAQVAQGERVQVNAVLMEDASTSTRVPYTVARDHVQVLARWYAPDSTVRVGQIVPNSVGRAGTVVRIWIDATGNVVPPPPGHQQVLGQAISIGVGTMLGIACGIGAVRLGVRRALDRRRMARWQLAWTQVEPQWSGRR
jgi:hypothetical protein